MQTWQKILELASTYHGYMENPTEAIKSVNRLDLKIVDSLKEYYIQGLTQSSIKKIGPVNLIRWQLLHDVSKGKEISEDSIAFYIQALKNRESEKFSITNENTIEAIRTYEEKGRDRFANWQNRFRLLHPLIFHPELATEINNYIENLCKDLTKKLNLPNYTYHKVDFKGSANFGSDQVWLALYPKSASSHQTAHQLFVNFDHTGISSGTYSGDAIKDQMIDRKIVENIDEAIEYLELVKDDLVEANKQLRQIFYYAPGERASRWEEMRSGNIIAIGWDHLGDLNQYEVAEELHSGVPGTGTAELIFKFRNANKGDLVVVKKGTKEALAIGVITGAYEFDESRTDFKHTRSVQWLTEKSVQFSSATFGKDTFWNTRKWDKIQKAYLEQHPETKAIFAKIGLETNSRTTSNTKPNTVMKMVEEAASSETFTVDDALKDLFFSKEEFEDILSTLKHKQNIVLQGPPGVGKTFIAKKIAYALMGEKNKQNLEMVQFHQSYSYEDFIQGFRPSTEGSFELNNGVFYEFCESAKNSNKPHVFIIDEINRGNLSKIFGELLLQIEKDKRGEDFAIPLTYSKNRNQKFFIPQNIFIIGTMNTADRSLTVVDYALRRRFAFINMKPKFESSKFSEHLHNQGVNPDHTRKVISKLSELNSSISADKVRLGQGFTIGHSFFCLNEKLNASPQEWYSQVIHKEIAPLLREYWFDDPDKAEQEIEKLVS